MWYIHITEYYSATKKNLLTSSAVTWVDLEIIILGEVRERQITYDITYMWNLNYDTNLFTRLKQTHRHKKQTYGHQSGKRVWDDQIYNTVYKINNKDLYLAQGTIFNIL